MTQCGKTRCARAPLSDGRASDPSPGGCRGAEYVGETSESSARAARAALASVDDATTTVLVLGHNPGWEDTVTELARRRIELKTAHAAVFESTRDVSWAELLAFENLKLVRVVTAGDD